MVESDKKIKIASKLKIIRMAAVVKIALSAKLIPLGSTLSVVMSVLDSDSRLPPGRAIFKRVFPCLTARSRQVLINGMWPSCGEDENPSKSSSLR